MRITCALSGLTFNCDHFPIHTSSRELAHPMFYLEQSKLLNLSSKWVDGELTATESYLLFLAILNSSKLVEWRVPVIRTARTNMIIAANMEKLVTLSVKTAAAARFKIALPFYSISSHSNTLDTVSGFLETWEDSLEAYAKKYKSISSVNKIMEYEDFLQKLIRDSSKKPENYAGMLANWAELAGDFPRFGITTPSGQHMPLNLYWKQLIAKCCKLETLYAIQKKDLQELLTHCEDYIPHGSIYAHALMEILRNGIKEQNDFFGTAFNDTITLVTTSADYKPTNVEEANLLAIIAKAPDTKPNRLQYPNLAKYMSAKLAWDMKVKYEAEVAAAPNPDLPTDEVVDETIGELPMLEQEEDDNYGLSVDAFINLNAQGANHE